MVSIWKKTTSNDWTNRLNWAFVKIALLAMMVPIYKWIYARWTAYESYYSHGPLVLAISGYFVSRTLWHYWHDPLPEVGESMRGSDWGLFWLGIVIYSLSCLIKVYFLIAIGVWMVIYAILRGSLPRKEWEAIRFWVWFTILAIPIPMVLTEQLALKLKNVSAILAGKLLTKIGITTKVVGNQIFTPFANLEVGAPCSGLRSILSLFTLSVLFSYLGRLSPIRSGILIFASPLVAMLGNVLRVFSLGLVADVYGTKVALGRFHDILGYVVFGFDLFVMWLLFKMLSKES